MRYRWIQPFWKIRGDGVFQRDFALTSYQININQYILTTAYNSILIFASINKNF